MPYQRLKQTGCQVYVIFFNYSFVIVQYWADIEIGIDSATKDIVDALDQTVTTEEKSPIGRREVEKTSGVIFKGNLVEVNHFLQKRLTDGLPIIRLPKTVAEMLYRDRSAFRWKWWAKSYQGG